MWSKDVHWFKVCTSIALVLTSKSLLWRYFLSPSSSAIYFSLWKLSITIVDTNIDAKLTLQSPALILLSRYRCCLVNAGYLNRVNDELYWDLREYTRDVSTLFRSAINFMNYSWILLLGLRRRMVFVIIAEKGLLYWERSPWVSALDTVSLREEAQLTVKFVSTQEIPSLVAWQNYREEMAVVLWQITPFGSIFSRQEQNRTSVVGCMQGFSNNFIYLARIWVFSPFYFLI